LSPDACSAVKMVTGRHPACKNLHCRCWFVGGNFLTGALNIL